MISENSAPVSDPVSGTWSLTALTPWELRKGVWWKREDHFAPLGLGGPNGSKMRQLTHLFQRHRGNATCVLTAASVLSPQHSMTAVAAHHFGMPSVHIIGGTTLVKAQKNPNVRIALGFGAEFECVKVGYNPELQRRLKTRLRPGQDFVVPYGITTAEDCSVDDLKAFHQVGGLQVQNLPESVETLIVPAGSCNSLTSVLYGLAKLGHKNLKQVVSIGIGPDKVRWTQERLEHLGLKPPLPFKWNRKLSLHTSGYAGYSDRMPESYAGIGFHPTYEGKIIRYLKEQGTLGDGVDHGGKLGFWIVAGEADEAVVCKHYPAGATGIIGEDLVDLGTGEVVELTAEEADRVVCQYCDGPSVCRKANVCGIAGADLSS